MRSPFFLVVGMTFILGVGGVAMASDAKGTLKYEHNGKTRTAEVKYAYLVEGPNAVEPTKITRQLFFSTADIGDAIKACQTLSYCAADSLSKGLAVLWVDVGSPTDNNSLTFSIGFKDAEEQFMLGSTPRSGLKATTDTATRLAGKLTVKSPSLTADVQFDTSLFKEFKE